MFKIEINTSDAISWDVALIKNQVLSALKIGMFDVERTSKKDYLTGPRPEKLGVVSNRLRSSIKGRASISNTNKLLGEVGTNVKYGKRHEEGINIRKRSFLATAIEDNIKNIEKSIMTAAENALGAGLK